MHKTKGVTISGYPAILTPIVLVIIGLNPVHCGGVTGSDMSAEPVGAARLLYVATFPAMTFQFEREARTTDEKETVTTEYTHASFVPVFETALDCLVMPSIMSCTSATPSDEDSLTSLPSPTSHWSLRKRFLVDRSVSKEGLRRDGDVCRDDETDTVTTRPLEEESESTLEVSSHRLQFFYRFPRTVSFQIPTTEIRGDRTSFEWSTLNHKNIWWSKEELRRIYKETREEAQIKVADGSYKLVNAAFAAIHKQANDASYKDSSITPLLHGSAAQQVLESARHIRGLELFSPPIKAATASHLHGVLAVQRSLLRKAVDLETRGAILRKASLRRSRASKAIAYLLGRVNCQEVREMLQEELSEKME